MAKTKKILSLLMALLMMFTVFPTSLIASAANATTVTVESVNAIPGSNVEVNINVKNNPGIMAANFTVTYDEGLTLIDSKSGDAFSALSMTKPETYNSPCKFAWDALEIADEDIKDGTILTLTFSVDKGVSANSKLNVKLSYQNGNIIDSDLNDIPVTVNNGSVAIIDYIPGDINGDGTVDLKDVTLVRRMVTGYSVTANKLAADVNGDGEVTMKDVVLIRRYVVDAEGYGVTLVPGGSNVHTHTMTATAEKAATCTEDGNIAYWYCSSCEKYFTDKDGNNVVSQADTIIKATGHTVVVDPAVEPTYESTGLTEGSHCSTCQTVLKKQEVIPIPPKTEYSITYHMTNNDNYLQSLNIENPNPTVYTSQEGLKLSNLTVDGYVFEGWYDGQGSNGELVKNIAVGTKGNIDLYAKWTPVNYTVQYKSDIFVDKNKDTYTVSEGLTLPTPRLSNYIFTGWTDEDGNLYKDGTIPVGTTGSIILTANWTSERNKTFTKPKLDAPIITEDEKSKTIFFAYEIGEIQNVPVYTIHDFGYISGDGITQTQTETYSTKISDTMMNSFAKSVSNATTKSSNWTLSKDWNEITSIDEQSYTEKGLTKEEAETIAKSNSNTWNISNGSSGSRSSTNVTTNNDGWENQSKTGKDTSEKKYKDNSFNINGKVSYTPSSATGGFGGELGGGYEHKWGSENTENNSSLNAESKSGSKSTSDTTAESTSWNSSSSKGGSSTNSTSKTTSNIISEKIAKTYGYGKSYSQGGGSSESQGLQSTQSEGEEYESAVTYSKEEAKTTTSTWTTQATKAGYHRWIMVGKAHVFAIVGYDMKNESFFTYTYSVMDDTEPLKQFEDYSYTTGSYNDAENGVIPFEVPIEVAKYVAERTCYSKGLKVDQSTGTITGYTGTDDYVVIPEYMNVGGGDVVKITGISSTAFKGNTKIKEVRLSDFITTVPNNAFEGCTSLFGLSGGSITSIGDNAFKNCTSMEIVSVDKEIISLGKNAFSGCKYLLVNAKNKNVALAAVNSGAKNIQLYINPEIIDGGLNAFKSTIIEVPATTESFALFGYNGTYSGLSIVSNAKSTFINKVIFTETSSIPLKISSPNVTLNQVSVDSKGIGLVLSANTTKLLMQGNIYITSDTDKSVLCKDISFGESNDKVDGKLTVSGKVYVAGTASETNYLAQKGKEIVYIERNMFDNFLNSHKIIFDANGGTVSENSRTLVYGSTLGKLPIPTKDYYTFNGWYTQKDGGNEVTANTTFESTDDVTYYAHWKQNDVSGWTKVSEMPKNAEVVNRKYSYNLTSYTTSSSSSLSGWTKYDTKSAWSDYGSWSSWQDSYVGSSDSRQVDTRRAVDSYNYKTVYNYYYYSKSSTNGNTSYTKSSSYPNRYTVSFDSALPKTNEGTKVPKQKYKWNNHHGTGKYMFVYADDPYTTKEVTSTNYKTQYRYRDRHLNYTYYYKKVEKKESTSNPSGQNNVSDVQEWVQYRAK